MVCVSNILVSIIHKKVSRRTSGQVAARGRASLSGRTKFSLGILIRLSLKNANVRRSSSVVEHAPEERGVVSSILTFGTSSIAAGGEEKNERRRREYSYLRHSDFDTLNYMQSKT